MRKVHLAFKNGILLKYPLPADESSLTPHF